MTVTTTAPAARTDVGTTSGPAAGDARGTDRFVRRAGQLLMAGAGSWALSTLVFGANADTYLGERMQDGSAFVFQLGAFALVTAMARTQALGPSRGARIGLVVERVLLALATLWTVLHFVDYRWADASPVVLALDAFWPLSMLGMLVVGIKLFRARQWRGSLRTAPLIAETWALVVVPAFAISTAVGQQWVADAVAALHLLVGYTRLGYLMHRSPELTRS